jgi:hypothetical protein
VIGCLTAPFKLLGCLGLIAILAVGWLYRDRLLREGRRLIDRVEGAPPATAMARPGARALKSAQAKVDSLNGWRADSVVLSPAEVASLVGRGMDPVLRSQLDSLQVRLLDGELELHARLRTARLPREVLGPLTVALKERESIEAAGPIEVTGPGRGEWEVRSFRIRDFPLPADMVPHVLARALGDSTRRAVTVRIPRGITRIRLRPAGATLYGASRP